MWEQLKDLRNRFLNLKEQLEKEGTPKDPEKYREFARLSRINDLLKRHEACQKELKDARKMAENRQDPELVHLAKEEMESKEKQLRELEDQLTVQLLPPDPNDNKNIILEIRAGAGGDEAGLFARELFEAYRQYALKRNWKIEVVSISSGSTGGYKEVISLIRGKGVYRTLKYESGVHRVQRVPKTESQGRIHTSTVTVVVLPEADPVEVKIRPEDLRIDVCRSSGAGGQHVNTTDSAVRVTHLPTKIMVYCQQEKSQHANKEKALKILSARLWDLQREKAKTAESEKRQEQMGGGDRSMRIRTYNFPQSRLTDHRAHLTQKNLAAVMTGDFDSLFSALAHYHQTKAAEELGKNPEN